jgi:hypothetical protein
MTNRYYVLPLPNDHSNLWTLIVEDANTVRKNLLQTKMIVKLYEGDETNHPMLNGVQEYTHTEIKQYLIDNDSEWNEPIDPPVKTKSSFKSVSVIEAEPSENWLVSKAKSIMDWIREFIKNRLNN